jgi:hypothetical protein
MDVTEPSFDHSTFSRNRERLQRRCWRACAALASASRAHRGHEAAGGTTGDLTTGERAAVMAALVAWAGAWAGCWALVAR